MKRLGLLLFAFWMISPMVTRADEGMWLVNLLQKSYPQMKKEGLKLSVDQLYNPNGASITDAVVALDGGMCTGSIISEEGLLITNHHCAYGDVHSLSTPQKNYLEEGFWAKNKGEEVVIPGKTVQFLRKVIDITDEVTSFLDSLRKTGANTTLFIGRKIDSEFCKRYAGDNSLMLSVGSMWKGSRYYLFFYEEFQDVRLVGAPPVSIGAFGGEQDNWGWPQHKGDFALYRVYAGKDGKPAPYSKNNVPITPKKVLTVSSKGVKANDYAMVFGYPGSTNRYMSSEQLAEQYYISNPAFTTIRRAKLDIWKPFMEKDADIRLKYSDKYFTNSNFTDFRKWENICLRRYNVLDIKKTEEKELAAWIEANPEAKTKYGDLLAKLKTGFNDLKDLTKYATYHRQCLIEGSEIIRFGGRFQGLVRNMEGAQMSQIEPSDVRIKKLKQHIDKFYATYDEATDHAVTEKMLQLYLENMSEELMNDDFLKFSIACERNPKRMADSIFKSSFLSNEKRCREFLSKTQSYARIAQDIPVLSSFPAKTQEATNSMQKKLGNGGIDFYTKLYTQALYEMRLAKGLVQYPDANSTMRLTYGTVGPINPYDGVTYAYQTSINGYLEKYNPEDYEFHVNDRMMSLIKSKDWGRWGENGQLYVNFLTNNDIAGGNSGSPVLNAKGELIGLAFDGNRESMSGDVYFHPEYFKTTCVDIRFVLWVIDKYAGAENLIKELRIVSK